MSSTTPSGEASYMLENTFVSNTFADSFALIIISVYLEHFASNNFLISSFLVIVFIDCLILLLKYVNGNCGIGERMDPLTVLYS